MEAPTSLMDFSTSELKPIKLTSHPLTNTATVAKKRAFSDHLGKAHPLTNTATVAKKAIVRMRLIVSCFCMVVSFVDKKQYGNSAVIPSPPPLLECG